MDKILNNLIRTGIQRANYIWGHQGFQKYLKNTGWMFFGRFISLLVSFLTTIYVVRYLGPENYGALSYAIGFVGMFSIIANFGIDQVLYREIIKNKEQADQYLGTGFFIKLFFSIIATILVIISSIFTNNDEQLIRLTIIILSLAFIFNSFSVIRHYFNGLVRSKIVVIITSITSIIIGLSKLLMIYLNEGVLYLSIVILFESIIISLLLVIFFSKEKNIFNWKYNHNIAKSITKDSWPFIFVGAFSFVYARIDQIMIQNIIDTSSVGIYDAAVRLTEVWYFIPSIIVASLFPGIVNAKLSNNNYRKKLIYLFLLMLFIPIIIIVFILFFSKQITILLYGKDFIASSVVLKIYILSLIGTFLGHLINSYLLNENYKKIIFINSLVAMILNVVLNIILIPKFGIVGAAYATVVSYTMIILTPLFFKRIRNKFLKNV